MVYQNCSPACSIPLVHISLMLPGVEGLSIGDTGAPVTPKTGANQRLTPGWIESRGIEIGLCNDKKGNKPFSTHT